MSAHGQQDSTLSTGFIDVRHTQGNAGTPLSNPADFTSVSTAETKLLANGYTQARLNTMTINDKIYALRLLEEASGIK